jgi:hypothetical protein
VETATAGVAALASMRLEEAFHCQLVAKPVKEMADHDPCNVLECNDTAIKRESRLASAILPLCLLPWVVITNVSA